MAQVVDRWQRGPERAFSDFHQAGRPIFPQIEAGAMAHNMSFVSPAWKVELAKRVKLAMLARNAKPIAADCLAKWENLFAALLA